MNKRQNNQAGVHVHNWKMSKSCFSLKIYIFIYIFSLNSLCCNNVLGHSWCDYCYFKECCFCGLSGDCGRKCRGLLLRLSGLCAGTFCLAGLETAARRIAAPPAGWEMLCVEAFTAVSTFPSSFTNRLRMSSNSTAIVLFRSAYPAIEVPWGPEGFWFSSLRTLT